MGPLCVGKGIVGCVGAVGDLATWARVGPWLSMYLELEEKIIFVIR